MIRYPGQYSIRIEYTPEPGITYSLMHPSREQAVLLGYDSPSFQQPALRFAELVLLARSAVAVDPGGSPEWAGRLLTPCAWPAAGDDKKAARAFLDALWTPSGTPPADRMKTFADVLLRAHTPITWTEDANLGFLCDGEYARRARRSEGGHEALTDDELRFVRQFFATIG